jgi:hypothetical protein
MWLLVYDAKLNPELYKRKLAKVLDKTRVYVLKYTLQKMQRSLYFGNILFACKLGIQSVQEEYPDHHHTFIEGIIS